MKLSSRGLDYGEVYFGASWEWLAATYYYSDNFFGIGQSATICASAFCRGKSQ